MAFVIHMLTFASLGHHVPAKGSLSLGALLLSTGLTCDGRSPFDAALMSRRFLVLTNLDAVINVRLTAAEKLRLKEDADIASVSMSELVRRRYFGRPLLANADVVMLKELRRLGGLLKHIHNESQGAYSADTARALGALTNYIQQLSRDRQEG